MAWIALYDTVRDHKKTYKAAELLKTSNAHIVGLLGCLWSWAATNAHDGDLTAFPVKAIASAAGWEKSPDKFCEAMIESGWLEANDNKLLIHDWVDYAEMLMIAAEDQKQKTKRRVQRYRERKNAADVTPIIKEETALHETLQDAECNVTQSVTRNVNGNATVTPCNGPIVPNLIVPNLGTKEEDVEARARTREGEPVDESADLFRSPQLKGLVDKFQAEYGHMATPTMISTLSDMLNTHTPDIISLAIDQASIQGKCTLAYVDGILVDWEASGVKTPEDVRRKQDEFNRSKKGGAKGGGAGDSKRDTQTPKLGEWY